MTLVQALQLPPVPKINDYPALMGVGGAVIFTALLLVVAKWFDPTGGTLTISLMVVTAFFGVVAFSLFFNIPADDEVTPAVVGGLVAAFGAVVAFWLGRGNGRDG
jgi:hypothetical protein